MAIGWGYVGDEWYLLDATCFEFTKEGNMTTIIDWYRTRNGNSSISHTSDVIDREKSTVTQTINISLSQLPATTHFLVFSITAYLSHIIFAFLTSVTFILFD
jgi:stress response protein SCP2